MPQHPHSDSFGKRVELSLRRALVRALSSSASATPLRVTAVSTPMPLPEPPRFLLLRQDKIGDVLVSMPVLRLLRRAYPRARIDVLLGKANQPMQQAVLHYADHVYRYDKKVGSSIALLRSLRRTQYDVAVDLMDKTSATSSVLLAAVNATYAIGLEKENAEVYTHVVAVPNRTTTHVVERTARVLLPLGIEPQRGDLALEYPLSAEDTAQAQAVFGVQQSAVRIGVNISGSSELRYWGQENWMHFLRTIAQRYSNAEVVVFAAPHHAQEQEAIAAATGVRAVPTVPTFHRFAALIRQCDMLVTPDTSVVHLAAAFCIPAVVLFSHTANAVSWHPYNSPHIVIAAENDSLAGIASADVLAAVEQVWAQL